MLILANGAFKCGSSWQHQILRRLVTSEEIPEGFQNPNWRTPSIDPEHLPRFLERGAHVDRDFVCKNHIRDPELSRRLIADPHVLICNLTRDIRDVLVSAFHHDQRVGRYDGKDLEEYYSTLGKQRIDSVLKHHRFWNVGHGGVFVGSYEALHNDFDSQVRAMGAFVGVSVNKRKLDGIRERTSFKRDSKSGPGQHRRKGIVGDWQGTLGEAVLEDLARRSTELPTPRRPARKPGGAATPRAAKSAAQTS